MFFAFTTLKSHESVLACCLIIYRHFFWTKGKDYSPSNQYTQTILANGQVTKDIMKRIVLRIINDFIKLKLVDNL